MLNIIFLIIFLWSCVHFGFFPTLLGIAILVFIVYIFICSIITISRFIKWIERVFGLIFEYILLKIPPDRLMVVVYLVLVLTGPPLTIFMLDVCLTSPQAQAPEVDFSIGGFISIMLLAITGRRVFRYAMNAYRDRD